MADRVKGKLTIDDKEVEIKQAMSREVSPTQYCAKIHHKKSVAFSVANDSKEY